MKALFTIWVQTGVLPFVFFRFKRYVPLKRRLTFNSLHGVITQNTEDYVTTAVITSNLTGNKQRKDSVACSQQANYTDCAAAACRSQLLPNSAGWGVSSGQRNVPYCRNLGFLDRSCYVYIQVPPQLSSWGSVNSVQTHDFSQNLVQLGIEPKAPGSVARTSDH
jgi:hypothetical protein